MLKSVLAVVAGFIVATVVMMAVEYTNGHVIYPELGRAATGVTDREAVRQLMAAAPAGALLVVLAGWLLGSAAGGFTATRIARSLTPAIIVGVLLLLGGIANNLMIPPPAWFWGSLIVFLPAAWYGGKLAAGK